MLPLQTIVRSKDGIHLHWRALFEFAQLPRYFENGKEYGAVDRDRKSRQRWQIQLTVMRLHRWLRTRNILLARAAALSRPAAQVLAAASPGSALVFRLGGWLSRDTRRMAGKRVHTGEGPDDSRGAVPGTQLAAIHNGTFHDASTRWLLFVRALRRSVVF